MTHLKLTTAQRDRVAGVLVGQACGDALGVPYEFQPPLRDATPEMIGGGLGPYAPGEWSDDTQMAACIAQVTADRASGRQPSTVLDDATLSAIGHRFLSWKRDGASDIGNQTSAVLSAASREIDHLPERYGHGFDGSAEHAPIFRAAAERYSQQHERSAGNGALMRNGIVGLTALGDRDATAENARNVAALTHADPIVLDSCVLHAEAIRHAVLTGEYDIFTGLDLVPDERRQKWVNWLETAEGVDPATIEANGSTFGALRAAHAAITSTQIVKFHVKQGGALHHVRAALEAAASAGHDTDTVAAITGAPIGAVYGVSAIPASWRRHVHGWPGLRERDLLSLALRTAGGAGPGQWPVRAKEPDQGGRAIEVSTSFDAGLRLGTQRALASTDADAVVSLSRIGAAERRSDHPERHVEFWLVDSDDPATHNDVDATLEDAADAIAELRAAGHTVLLHCVHAHHRTPSVALIYAVKHCGLTVADATRSICRALDVADIDGMLWSTSTHLAQEYEEQTTHAPKGR